MDEDLGPLACHCFAARQLARHVSKIYERHLAPVGLSSTQMTLLSFLRDLPDTTIKDLAARMVMDRTTLLRAAKPLQRDGLILGAPKAGLPRQIAFSLTPLGVSKLDQALPLWLAAQQEHEARVGPEVAARLRREFLTMTGQI